jgi:hypothetical protein
MQSARCWNQMGNHDKALVAYKRFMEEPYTVGNYRNTRRCS